MDEREQLILNLYYVEELTLREIAYILDISTQGIPDPWENPNKVKRIYWLRIEKVRFIDAKEYRNHQSKHERAAKA